MDCFLEISIDNNPEYTFRTSESRCSKNVHVRDLEVAYIMFYSGKTSRET
jgi:hypothetical protein